MKPVWTLLFLGVICAGIGGSMSSVLRGRPKYQTRCPRAYPIRVRDRECSKMCHPIPDSCKRIHTPKSFYDKERDLKLRNCPRCVDLKDEMISSGSADEQANETSNSAETEPCTSQDNSHELNSTANVTDVISDANNETATGNTTGSVPVPVNNETDTLNTTDSIPAIDGNTTNATDSVVDMLDNGTSNETSADNITDSVGYGINNETTFGNGTDPTLHEMNNQTNATESTSNSSNSSNKGQEPNLESGAANPCPEGFPILVREDWCKRECFPVDSCDFVLDGFILYDSDTGLTLEGCPECYVDDVVPSPPEVSPP